MNVITRGVKNATRGPMRSVTITIIFALCIALVLSMLVARQSVLSKIAEIKETAGTTITIQPAGIMGFQGGGDPLTSEQVAAIRDTVHITSTVLSLSDQLGTDDTELESSIDIGSFGQRQMRFEQGDTSATNPFGSTTSEERPAPTSRITVTGTTDSSSVNSTLTITSGESFATDSSDAVALIGTDLAEKNTLSVGDTFTAYSTSITVLGIYETGNTFQDGNIIMPIKTLQSLTDQADAVTSVIARVDSSDNVASVIETLEASLDNAADITSDLEQAEASTASLQSIASLALAGVIGATVAGAVIILLAMVIIMRERRREIAIMKAIGGTDIKVVGQFAIEGLALTIAGMTIGLLLGVLVSGPMTTSLVQNQTSESSEQTATTQPGQRAGGPGEFFRGGATQISNNITQVSASLTPSVFLAASGITIAIALIGSIAPAWFISRIRPAEALRSE